MSSLQRCLRLALAALILPACGGGSGNPLPAADTTAPAAITTLAVVGTTDSSVTLSWTAPGNDGMSGTAASYELRFAGTPILDLAAWNSATLAAGAPAPSAPGSIQTFTLTGLSPHTAYSFAIRTSDQAPNTSGLSNSPSHETTMAPPGQFAALTVSPTQIDLHWLDEAADESGYRVERSTDGITYNVLTTLPAGLEFYPDTNLATDTPYHYRVTTLHATGIPAGATDVARTLPLTGGWRTQGRDVRHAGYPVDATGTPPLTPAWTVSLGTPGYPLHPAVVENGRVFLTAYSQFAPSTRVWARNLVDGTPAWDVDYGSVFVLGHPAVFQGKVFVPVINTNSSSLSARDAATGASLWTAPFPAQFPTIWSPTVVGHRLYMNAGQFQGVYAWDTNSGTPLFANTSLAQVDQWSPLYVDGRIHTYDGASVRAHHPTTGAVLWSLPLPRTFSYAMNTSPVYAGGRIFIVAEPELAAVDPVTHSVLWSTSGFNYKGAAACADGVVFALNDGTLHARDAVTGALLWTFLGDRQLSFPPVVVNNHVYVSSDNNLYAVNLGTRSVVWTTAAGGWVTISDNTLLLSGTNGVLSAFTFSPASRPSESAPPAAPTGLVAFAATHARIDLSWTEPPTGVMGYQVERSSDNVNWSLLTKTGYGSPSAFESGLAPSVLSYYRVRAFNSAGTSGPSASASATSLVPTAWSTLGADPQHTGDRPLETLTLPPSGSFGTVIDTNPLHPVAVEDSRIFVTVVQKSKLIALDGNTIAWSLDLGPGLDLGPPAVDRGRVVVPSRDLTGSHNTKLFCFDATTGQILWTGMYRTQTGESYAPTIVGDKVFLAEAFNYGMAAFRVSDGGRLFENVAVTSVDNWTPSWQGGILYSHTGYNFRAHDPSTGVELWSTTLPWNPSTPEIGSVAVLGSTHAYMTSTPNLCAVNLATHALDWTVSGAALPSPSYIGTPALSGGKVFAHNGLALEVRDASGLGFLWSFAGDGALKYPPVVASGHVYVSSSTHTYAVNLTTHAQVWSANVGGWLAIAGGRLYIAAPGGSLNVYVLQ